MVAEYRPLERDSRDDIVLNSSDHQLLHSDSSINLLPQQNQSSQVESLITTINIREEYEHQHATATPFSCVINLANTILGTGMLAMVKLCFFFFKKITNTNIFIFIKPSAMASVGILPGFFLILLSAFASGTGLYFLSRCAARIEGRNASFFAISKLTWPKVAVLFDLAIAIKCFGVAVSYLIIIGDLMPHVIVSLSGNSMNDLAYFLTDRRFWITIFMITMVLPLSFLRKLDSLKYTSLVSLVAVIYLFIIIVYHYYSPNYPPPPPEAIEIASFSTRVLGHLPVFVFAFTCHQNVSYY